MDQHHTLYTQNFGLAYDCIFASQCFPNKLHKVFTKYIKYAKKYKNIVEELLEMNGLFPYFLTSSLI